MSMLNNLNLEEESSSGLSIQIDEKVLGLQYPS